MKLKKLNIKNFKGIPSFTLLTNGGNTTNIFGDNAAGKTTLVDALCWLLFDKNSKWKKSFRLKPLDAEGNEIHNLETEVEGKFELANGTMLTLKKVYQEKYTKKRGAAFAEFTGHETDYKIDGVPSKKKEFTSKIAEFADEESFKLLTNPTYFSEQLKWPDRREILLNVCGDITDADVIKTTPELAELPAILGGKPVDNYRKIAKATRTEINDELVKIPAKIEGANEVLPERIATRADVIVDRITTLHDKAEEKRQERVKIQAGGMVAEKEKQVAEIDTDIAKLRTSHTETVSTMTRDKREELEKLEDEAQQATRNLSRLKDTVSGVEQDIKDLKVDNTKLGTDYDKIAAAAFDDSSTICPTCNQNLPDDQVNAAKKRFNTEKANNLQSINKTGVSNKTQMEKLESELTDHLDQKGKMEKSLTDLKGNSSTIQAEIENLNTEAPKVESLKAYTNLMNQKGDLQGEISQLQSGQQGSVDKINQEIGAINDQIKEQQTLIDQIDTRNTGEMKIKEYEGRQKELAGMFEKTEKHLALLDLFVQTKVSMLEGNINSNFKLARFRLFEKQINGGIQEVCETVLDGIPYGSLNNAGCIQVGMDIINTLSSRYGFAPMIFVDNAEAVTRLPEMESQVIALFVSEADKELRVA